MQTVLKIEGMKCGGCVSSVEKALKANPDVSAVEIDLTAGSARIEHAASVAAAALVAAVEDAGFDAKAS